MFGRNLTLLKYYQTTKQEWSTEKVIQVIDAICMNYFPEPNEKFANEVVEFVEYFKRENQDFFIKHQDSIVFRMYADIIKNKVQKQSDDIHSKLTKEEQIYASNFVDRLFALNMRLVAIVSANLKTHMQSIDSMETLNTIIEFLLYSQNAVLLLHGTKNNQTHTFGFMLKDGKFIEIDKNTLRKMSKNQDTHFTTLSEISPTKG